MTLNLALTFSLTYLPDLDLEIDLDLGFYFDLTFFIERQTI